MMIYFTAYFFYSGVVLLQFVSVSSKVTFTDVGLK